MRLRSFFLACAGAVVSLAVTAVVGAQEMQMQSEPAPANGGAMVDCCCCDQSCWFFSAEATFFRFHDSAGVEDANFTDGEFDFEASPRLTIGYVGCDGLGARLRYWDYDHDTRPKYGLPISVDTYNIDFEVFQVVELNCCTALEISAGIRYNDFDYRRIGYDEEFDVYFAETNAFDGIGGMIGIEARRDLGNGLGVYARLREVIMMDDGVLNGNSETDVTRPITEIAFGTDYCYCGWNVYFGLEWQNWANYGGRDQVDSILDLTSDVGFAGFVLGVSTSY